jgi:hypothetical protein
MQYECFRYDVIVPLADGTTGFTICECDSTESAAAIVQILLAPAIDGPTRVEIVKKKVVRTAPLS